MKQLFALLLALPLIAGAADFRPRAISPRKIEIAEKTAFTLTKDNVEIVLRDAGNDTARYAASEMAEFLGRTLGGKLSVLSRPTGKKSVIYIGLKEKSEVQKLDRDGFIIRTTGKDIEIGGHDEKGNPARSNGTFARGTLFGVYDFLERFAGVRFYFPGEHGVVVTPAKVLNIPFVSIIDRPDMQFRTLYLNPDAPQMEGQAFVYPGITEREMRRLISLRSRSDTMFLPNCHGLAYLGYVQRFGKTHPEYFALKADGTRYNGLNASDYNKNGQLCFSNAGMKEEIYQDAVAVLTGKSAESRKIVMPNGKCYWAGMFRAPYFNVMPNDSLPKCFCPECRKKLNISAKATSDFYWDCFIDLAERLQKNKIPGFVTTMCYHPYHLIPDRKIPENMIVELALSGAWSEGTAVQKISDQRIKDWVKKTGSRIYIWTYANKQYMPWVPNFAPRTVGKYYKRQAPYLFGTFYEGESDIWLFSYLNYYVLSRVLWNTSTDVDAVVEEHYQKMFGPAAPEMKEFFDTIERKWMKNIVGNIVETSEGPTVVRPPEFKIWNEIFSPAFLTRARKLFADGIKKSAKFPEIKARLEFFRKNYLGAMEEGARRFAAKCSERNAWSAVIPEITAEEKPVLDGKVVEKCYFKAAPLYLSARKDQKNEVRTKVYRCRDKENFYFAFVCEEPFTANMSTVKGRKKDDPKLWEDNTVEVLLDTDGNRKFHQQFILNSDGIVTDLVTRNRKSDYQWNTQAEAKAAVVPGKQWSVEVRIPVKDLAPMTKKTRINANFTRVRMLKNKKIGTVLYSWCRMMEDHRPDEFGVLYFQDPERKNLLNEGDFAARPIRKNTMIGNWVNKEQGLNRDTEYYKTAGASLRFDAKSTNVRQWFKGLKPDTLYELSFYVRLQDVKPTAPRGGFYARINDSGRAAHYLPAIPLTGTLPWTYQSYRFRTSKKVVTQDNTIDFNRYRVNGTVWIDHVGIYEIK